MLTHAHRKFQWPESPWMGGGEEAAGGEAPKPLKAGPDYPETPCTTACYQDNALKSGSRRLLHPPLPTPTPNSTSSSDTKPVTTQSSDKPATAQPASENRKYKTNLRLD